MVTSDVVELDAVRVKVIKDADAELGLAIIPQLVSVIRLRLLPTARVGPRMLTFARDRELVTVGASDDLPGVLNAHARPVVPEGVAGRLPEELFDLVGRVKANGRGAHRGAIGRGLLLGELAAAVLVVGARAVDEPSEQIIFAVPMMIRGGLRANFGRFVFRAPIERGRVNRVRGLRVAALAVRPRERDRLRLRLEARLLRLLRLLLERRLRLSLERGLRRLRLSEAVGLRLELRLRLLELRLLRLELRLLLLELRLSRRRTEAILLRARSEKVPKRVHEAAILLGRGQSHDGQ